MKIDFFSNKNTNTTPKLMSEKEEEQLEKNLVWIFGMRRSGTTWLAHELLSYNTLHWDEPWCGGHLGIRTMSGDRAIDKNQVRKNYFFNNSFKDSWMFFLRKLILHRIFSEFHDVSKKIIIKEPNGSLAADIILESLPKSKFILVKRDCRDNIDSVLNGMKKDGWRAKWQRTAISEEQKLEFIKDEAKTIKKTWEVLLRAFENHAINLRYTLRYEDLRYHTVEELKKIYDFVGIKIDDNTIREIADKFSFENIPTNQKGEGKSKRSATPGLWKENLHPHEIEIIDDILCPTLKKLGYL